MSERAFLIVIAIAVAFMALVVVGAVAVRRNTERSLAACRDRDGFADYFDALRPDNWRCVGAGPERAP